MAECLADSHYEIVTITQRPSLLLEIIDIGCRYFDCFLEYKNVST